MSTNTEMWSGSHLMIEKHKDYTKWLLDAKPIIDPTAPVEFFFDEDDQIFTVKQGDYVVLMNGTTFEMHYPGQMAKMGVGKIKRPKRNKTYYVHEEPCGCGAKEGRKDGVEYNDEWICKKHAKQMIATWMQRLS